MTGLGEGWTGKTNAAASQPAGTSAALDFARTTGRSSFTEFLDSHHRFLRQLLVDSIPVDHSPLEIGERFMRDVLFIFVTVIFFLAAILYLRGCERLK
jgi:hypothetical protein